MSDSQIPRADPPTMDDVSTLRVLEEDMWRFQTRGDHDWMEAHVTPDFVEFGKSGRRYTRAEILATEIGMINAVLPLHDLNVTNLGTTHVLVTYQSEVDGERANRSSIWQRTKSGWLMQFHQGTPTEFTSGR